MPKTIFGIHHHHYHYHHHHPHLSVDGFFSEKQNG
jgi:hypothetical protein